MGRQELKTAPTLRLVYACDVQGNIEVGEVVHESPKQFKVREGGQWSWISTRSKDTDTKWHPTRLAAIEARIVEIQGKIDWSKQELQRQRTWLGMVEGVRLNERTESSRTDDAVAWASRVNSA